MTRSIDKALTNLQDAWEQAAAISAGNKLEDGDYAVSIAAMEICFSNAGRLQAATTFKVSEGSNKGSTIRRYDGLDNDTSMGFFKGYCNKIGLELPDELDELPKAIKSFVKDNSSTKYMIALKTVNDFQNVYINDEVTDTEDLEDDILDEDFEDMSKEELLEYIEDNDLEIKKANKLSKAKLIEAIEAVEDDDDEDEDEDEDVDEEAPSVEDLDGLDKDELLEYIDDNELYVEDAEDLSKAKLKKAIIEAIEENDEDEDDEDDEDEDVEIDDMSKADLIEYIEDNDLEIKGYKKLTLAKLRKKVEEAIED